MTRTVAVLGLALLTLLTLAVAPATAQNATSNETATDWQRPGPFELSELKTGGDHPAESPDSVRYLKANGETAGAIALRYRPSDPLSNKPTMLEPGTTVQTDTIQMYSTVFGDATGEYELVIVYWQPATKTVNETTVRYAANQTVQRATFDVGSGYNISKINLYSHYKQEYQATAWLEHNGERVDGARWRFVHKTVPTSQRVQIQTRGDAWVYALRTALLPGAAGILLGLTGARLTLKRTGTGPRLGMAMWALIGTVGALIAVSGIYYEIATVIAHVDVLMGLSLAVVAYGGGLRMHPPVEYVGFQRSELDEARALRQRKQPDRDTEPGADPLADGGQPTATNDAVEIPGDAYQDEMYEDLPRKPTVRSTKGGRRVPKKGIRPWLARLFADAAELDLSDLRTRVRIRTGCIDEKVYTHPEGEGVKHTPARLATRLPVWHRLSEPETDGDDGEDAGPDMVTKAVFGVLTVATLALPYIGYRLGETVMNTPLVGAGVGTILLALEAYEARNGRIDFEPAPRHFMTADASLTILQNEHADAKTLEEMEEMAWEERQRTALEAREVEARRDKTILQRMNERAIGMDLSIVENSGLSEIDEEDVLGGPDDGGDDADARTNGRGDDD